ncbi:tripartite tricarboxylate transporter substrate binding protein [Ramlibacter sp. AN1015]|uniref:Bug family tripartite tricarboxylate transporter substrate binding protein n=1 Tax=Ramlibacter sp. AN1015 TaxID=3133428 RepID=UPI0030C63184
MNTSLSLSRRAVLTAAGLALAAGGAFAQAPSPAWPTKPVRLVVNFPPGGPLDILARAMGESLQKQLGQPFVVENKPGAGGNIGADAGAKAAADGHTVLFTIDSTVTVNPHIYKSMAFSPSDLKPVMIMSSSGLLVGVHPQTGFKTMNDLVQGAKAKTVNFSSAGPGSPGHLAAAMATDATGMKINHIPYKGNAPAVTAVLSGEVDGGVLATPGMLPHVKAGKVTPLAVTSRQRSALAPDIPTVGQAGLPQLEQEVLYMAMVPAATPAPVVQALEKAMVETLNMPAMRERLKALDMHAEGQTGAEAAKRLSDLRERYGKVITATGMKVE